jgi:hypothetical protein
MRFFLNVVSAGFRLIEADWNQYENTASPPWETFNHLFEKRDAPYRYDAQGNAELIGD